MASTPDGGSVLKYSVLFFPGDFFIFWNVLVPMSVLLNMRHFGLRVHEIGLAVALALNPFLLKYFLHSPIMAWVIALFLIIWIERVLRRWSWYKIYTWSFLKSLLMVSIFIALPSLLLRTIWEPVCSSVMTALKAVLPDAPCDVVVQTRDLIMLSAGVLLLLHSFYFYSQHNKCVSKPVKAPEKAAKKKRKGCGC